MSALYAMRYVGQSGLGMGAIYIGKGKIVGIDTAGGRYDGNYSESGGRLKATVNMHMPAGAVLVTGQQVAQATTIPLSADWPTTFADGSAQQIMVAGKPVSVTFEKIGNIP